MAITALGAVQTYQSVSTTFGVSLPAGIANGTLLKMILTSDSAGQVLNTPPAGWTLDSHDLITHGDGQSFWKYSRVSDGSDGATVSMVFNIIKGTGAIVDGFNGCDNSVGAFGAGERSYLLTNADSVSVPSSPVSVSSAGITANAGDMLVFHCGVDTNGNNGTYTTPAGFGTIVQTPSGSQFGSCAGAELLSGGGATGTTSAVWTQPGNNGNFLIYFMALKSASAPTPPVLPQGPMPRRIFILP